MEININVSLFISYCYSISGSCGGPVEITAGKDKSHPGPPVTGLRTETNNIYIHIHIYSQFRMKNWPWPEDLKSSNELVKFIKMCH